MANKYFHASGGTGNWSDGTGTWRTTDQGATITTAPTSADVAIMTANAGNRTLTVDVDSACSALNATGFTGTVSGSAPLVISGNFIFPGTATWSFTGDLTLGVGAATGTWNFSGGLVHEGNLFRGGTGAKTQVGGDFTVMGLTTITGTHQHNGAGLKFNIYDYYATNNFYTITSTTNVAVYLKGGTLSGYEFPVSTNGVYIDGNCVVSNDLRWYGGTSQANKPSLIWNSGTFDTATNSAVIRITGAGAKLNLGNNIELYCLSCGATTIDLLSDLYLEKLHANATTSVINGAYKVFVSKTWYSRNVVTWTGTATIEMTGTGNLLYPYDLDDTSYNDVSCSVGLDVIINTAGTITCYPRTITWTGGKSLVYTAGTFVTTGTDMIWIVNNYSFYCDCTIYSLQVTGSYCTFYNNFTVTNYRQIENTVCRRLAGTTFTIGDEIFIAGSSTATTVFAGQNFVTEFVSGNGIPIIGTLTPNTAIIPNTGNSANVTTGNSLSIDNINTGVNFTIAFTIEHINPSTNTYLLSNATGTQNLLINPKGAIILENTDTGKFISNGPNNIFSSPRRIVITKADADSAMKLYIDGVLKIGQYYYANGASFTMPNITKLVPGVENSNIQEFVIFNEVKDQNWVDADYNDGAGKKYTSSETGIVLGFHFDESSFKANLVTGSTFDNQRIFKTDLYELTATSSTGTIYAWHSTVVNCTNIKSVTGANIGGHGVSTTHY